MNSRTSWLGRADATGIPLAVARLFVGVMFITLAWAKIADPITFLKLMRQYQMLDEQSGYVAMNLIAVILPWLELACGVAILLGVALRGAGIVSAGMLVVFTPMIFKRGLELFQETGAATLCSVNFDCGCGAGPVFLCTKLLENSALLLAAILVIVSRSRKFCLGGLFNRSTQSIAEPEPAL